MEPPTMLRRLGKEEYVLEFPQLWNVLTLGNSILYSL